MRPAINQQFGALGELATGGSSEAESLSSPEPQEDRGEARRAPTEDGEAEEVAGDTNLTHSIPGVENGRLSMNQYTWDTWTEPQYQERRKESYWYVQDVFAKYSEDR